MIKKILNKLGFIPKIEAKLKDDAIAELEFVIQSFEAKMKRMKKTNKRLTKINKKEK